MLYKDCWIQRPALRENEKCFGDARLNVYGFKLR